MGRGKKKKQAATSRSHIAKTPDERTAYDEKVKLSNSQGETKSHLGDRSSTLSGKSVFGNSQNVGTPDRNPIKPPTLYESKPTITIKSLATIGSILFAIIAAAMWLGKQEERIDSNETGIQEVEDSLKGIDSEREKLTGRIIQLEQWKDTFDEELDQLRTDLDKGVSPTEIDLKLMELEKRILQDVRGDQSAEK